MSNSSEIHNEINEHKLNMICKNIYLYHKNISIYLYLWMIEVLMLMSVTNSSNIEYQNNYHINKIDQNVYANMNDQSVMLQNSDVDHKAY